MRKRVKRGSEVKEWERGSKEEDKGCMNKIEIKIEVEKEQKERKKN